MDPILSLCGFRCDLCLAYQPNIEAHPENRQVLSDGWHTYFGFTLPPEKTTCKECFAESSETLDRDCPVRLCVIECGFSNCASCEDYICDKLTQRLIDFDEIQADTGKAIPEIDRQRFILPYENAVRLRELRHK